MIAYGQADGFITPEIVGELDKNNYAKRQTAIMNDILPVLFDYSEEDFFYGNFSIKYFEYYTPVENTTEIGSPEVIEFGRVNVEVKLWPHHILNLVNGMYLLVTSYDRYPYMKNGNDKMSSRFVSFKAFDNDKKEIDISSISSNMYPSVKYSLRTEGNNDFQNCFLFYNETSEVTNGTISKDGYGNIFNSCVLRRFGAVTASYKKPEEEQFVEKYLWLVIL